MNDDGLYNQNHSTKINPFLLISFRILKIQGFTGELEVYLAC